MQVLMTVGADNRPGRRLKMLTARSELPAMKCSLDGLGSRDGRDVSSHDAFNEV